jgi:hypothetical protein
VSGRRTALPFLECGDESPVSLVFFVLEGSGHEKRKKRKKAVMNRRTPKKAK